MTKALIIEANFYQNISDKLRNGAASVFKSSGVDFDIITVPGALEIPAALLFSANKKLNLYDCYVVLGCVIRGETSHYEIVCSESARGIYDTVYKYTLALGNGILTVENEEQAMERADPLKKDKGGAAAKAALKMIEIKHKIKLCS